ncbi:hypothetical protein BU16DRAFT_18671 [Lophium mytilinum]|uniref:Uncharacterized protein n=1 Tax=Lophium mytilinum TaxID=390894 RepID=A0A6A6RD30_9PEZI|nr:hypothetical protein BU16DRAFT_18671 [Lophium mytilinum]
MLTVVRHICFTVAAMSNPGANDWTTSKWGLNYAHMGVYMDRHLVSTAGYFGLLFHALLLSSYFGRRRSPRDRLRLGLFLNYSRWDRPLERSIYSIIHSSNEITKLPKICVSHHSWYKLASALTAQKYG